MKVKGTKKVITFKKMAKHEADSGRKERKAFDHLFHITFIDF
jgi:hypothetical protein